MVDAKGQGHVSMAARRRLWQTLQMAEWKARTFSAVLEADGTALRWTIARVPFDPAKAWPGRKGRRVRGTINGLAFRTTVLFDLHPQVGRSRDILVINKKMQAAVGVGRGDRVRIVLEPDLEERKAEVPVELAKAMRQVAGLGKWFEGLSPSARRELGYFVSEPKTAGVRAKRAVDMTERLFLAMEGEQETPPILRAAFAREPLAEAGWKAMTVVQRRRHLLGIFYYRTADGRDRRARKVVEDCLRVARKGGRRGPAAA